MKLSGSVLTQHAQQSSVKKQKGTKSLSRHFYKKIQMTNKCVATQICEGGKFT